MDPQEPDDPDRYRYEFPSSPSDYHNRPGISHPAHGGTILTIGIVSLLCCGILLGPAAWAMGNVSLKRIDEGLADPCETAAVEAGRNCGAIATLAHGFLVGIFIVSHVFGNQSAPYYQYLPYHNYP